MFETGKQWTYGQAARSRNANIITHRLKKKVLTGVMQQTRTTLTQMKKHW